MEKKGKQHREVDEKITKGKEGKGKSKITKAKEISADK